VLRHPVRFGSLLHGDNGSVSTGLKPPLARQVLYHLSQAPSPFSLFLRQRLTVQAGLERVILLPLPQIAHVHFHRQAHGEVWTSVGALIWTLVET
jgi:hypothetical protein